jgi:hypothetical protein
MHGNIEQPFSDEVQPMNVCTLNMYGTMDVEINITAMPVIGNMVFMTITRDQGDIGSL